IFARLVAARPEGIKILPRQRRPVDSDLAGWRGAVAPADLIMRFGRGIGRRPHALRTSEVGGLAVPVLAHSNLQLQRGGKIPGHLAEHALRADPEKFAVP